MIDIRSDTVTRPTPTMRKAMAEAEVGDDVYGDDPTINKLEKLSAEILGKEDAVFVPSGTFGNQLALFTWCERGTEVLLDEDCHIIQHEAGGAAIIAGVQTRPIKSENGIPPADSYRERLRRQDLHAPPTSLICLENAHSNGRVVPLPAMEEIRKLCFEWKLPIHLDGARIFNAAAALGCEAKDIAAMADSVMFCLSKGLCAPVGSILAGKRDFIERARYKRKVMGGGMRQAGILAAAGILALQDEHTKGIIEDHRQAKILASELSKIPGIKINPDEVDINLVFFKWPPAADKKAEDRVMEVFKRHNIIINPPGDGNFRFVTHYYIRDDEVKAILTAAREAFGG
ncbi:MAG: low-specificity L-threonine aldolase [Treponema sp.]|nr:low-specificity L-threonine aldolase [Treponema sp.]